MLCSSAVSLLQGCHACSRASDYVTSAASGRLWADLSEVSWFLDRVHPASLFSICWVAMSIILLQVVAYDLIRPFVIVRKLSTSEVGSTLIHVSENSGPLTFGAIKPKIVVPRYFLGLDSQAQELILAHEREHILKHDWLLKALALLTLALLPWNPVLYWQLARLNRAIELDCDARVLIKLGYADRRKYVNCLLRIADQLSSSGLSRSLLTERIRILMLQGA